MNPLPGLKPGVSGVWHDLAILPRLFSYVSFDNFFIDLPNGFGKISIRPEAIPPEELF